MDLIEVTRRLAQIDELLDGEFSQPSEDHLALLKERDELRSHASVLWAGPLSGLSDDQLEAQLDVLRRARKTAIATSTGFVTGKGGSNQGPSSAAWVKLGGQARAASGAEQLTQQISSIEDELARRQS